MTAPSGQPDASPRAADPTDRRRFVVLHHTGVPQPHFDLLFERRPDGPLVAFRLPIWPIKQSAPITELPDHRRHYLTYEGPISDDRGRVQRIVGGWADVQPHADGWTLVPTDCASPIHLFRDAAGAWKIQTLNER